MNSSLVSWSIMNRRRRTKCIRKRFLLTTGRSSRNRYSSGGRLLWPCDLAYIHIRNSLARYRRSRRCDRSRHHCLSSRNVESGPDHECAREVATLGTHRRRTRREKNEFSLQVGWKKCRKETRSTHDVASHLLRKTQMHIENMQRKSDAERSPMWIDGDCVWLLYEWRQVSFDPFLIYVFPPRMTDVDS